MASLGRGPLLVDTDILCNDFKSRSHANTPFRRAIRQFHPIYISVITVFEVEAGAKAANRESDIQHFLTYLRVLVLTRPIAMIAASIAADLKKRNKMIQIPDILIAATALHQDLPILTSNTDHFGRIKEVQLVFP